MPLKSPSARIAVLASSGIAPRTAWLLALLSALLQVLIFPSPSLSFLAWIALSPLMVAVLASEREGPPTLGRAFLLGYFCGTLFYIGNCYWIYHVMHVYGRLNFAVAVGILLGLCLVLGLFHGAFAFLLALASRRGLNLRRALLLSPFLWVGLELARARITVFPWDLLGYAQVGNIALTRIATVAGVYGVSFEIAVINAGFAAAFLVPARRRGTLLAGVLIAAVLLQAGSLLVPPPSRHDHVVTLVQANIPILYEDQWTPELVQNTLASLDELSLSASRDAEAQQGIPGLIVWPESPAPFVASDQGFRARVGELARAANAYVVAGSLGLQQGQGIAPQQMFNSAVLISPTGAWAGRYDKIHLVPFGEYVPYKSLFSFAGKLTREVGEFTPGTSRHPLELGEYKLGVFICYESVFPEEIRQFARSGAQVFVNISNDGWFGLTGAPGQHLNMVRMRAIENRRWALRATNTGITAGIDPFGRVVARAPSTQASPIQMNQGLTLNAPYAFVNSTTFYTRHGDWFAYVCAIIGFVGLLPLYSRKVSGRLIWTKN